MFSLISRFILWMIGWKVVGTENLSTVKKYLMIVIPHTSNWDFPIGILTRSAYKIKIKFMAKDSLFKPPFGFFFRWLGGIPVNRSKRTNFVQEVVNTYDRHEVLATVMAPEGTRSKVDKLKSGFYYMAKGANVPLILTKFDYGNKTVDFGEPFYPTDDQEADFAYLRDYYKGVKAKNPKLAWPGNS